jgi:hypothetical protein
LGRRGLTQGEAFPLDLRGNILFSYIWLISSLVLKKKRKQRSLKYIQAASPDVIKYFHPNHVENSDRIKTGYLKALESFRGDVM